MPRFVGESRYNRDEFYTPDSTMTKMTQEQRAKLADLALEVGDVVFAEVESFRTYSIGSDLAYLMLAILSNVEHDFVDWSEEGYGGRPKLLDILWNHFAPDHEVWRYIGLDEWLTEL